MKMISRTVLAVFALSFLITTIPASAEITDARKSNKKSSLKKKGAKAASTLTKEPPKPNEYHRTPKDIFTITDKVKYKNAEDYRFGINLSRVRYFAPWNSSVALNCFSSFSSFEPIESIHGWICDDGGKNFLEHNLVAGLHWFDCAKSGYWDGADCWVYRIEDGEMKLLRKSKVKKSVLGPDTENRLYFEKNGPEVRSGDIYSLRKTFFESPRLLMADRLIKKSELKGIHHYGGGEIDSGNPWLLDRTQKCPEGGSSTSLKMELTKGHKGKHANALHAYFVSHQKGNAYFDDNVDYKYEIWMRQEGVPEGAVTIELGPFYKETLKVTDQWQKFEGELNTDTFAALAALLDQALKKGPHLELKKLNDELLELAEWDGEPPADLSPVADLLEGSSGKAKFWADFVEEVPKRLAYLKEISSSARLYEINEDWIMNYLNFIKKLSAEEIVSRPEIPGRRMVLEVKKVLRQVKKSKDGQYPDIKGRDAYIAAAKALHDLLTGGTYSDSKLSYTLKCQAVVDQMKTVTVSEPVQKGLVDRLVNVVPRPRGYSSSHMSIGAEAGTLWIDNFIVYRADIPKFSVMPWMQEALKDMRPGMTRIWKGLHTPSVDAWINQGFKAAPAASIKALGAYDAFSLPNSLALCAYAGSNPWLILNPYWPEEDIMKLMEYLYAPATKGYGKVRAAQGYKEPWSKKFPMIYLECANEAWNNMFMPYAWPGNPEIYARISDMQFGFIKKSPYYDEKQIKLVVDGRADTRRGAWSQKVASFIKHADFQDFASYFGGWDGATVLGKDDEELLFNQLMFGPQILEPTLIQAMNIDKLLHRKMATVLTSDSILRKDLFDSVDLPMIGMPDGEKDLSLEAKTLAVVSGDMEIDPSKMEGLRKQLNSPVSLMMMLAVKDPEYFPIFKKVYAGLPEELIKPVAIGMAQTIGKSDRLFKRLVKIDPKAMDILIQWVDASLDAGVNRGVRNMEMNILKELNDFKKRTVGGYGFTRSLKSLYAPQVLAEIAGNDALNKRLKETFSWNIGLKNMRAVNGSVDMILSRLSEEVANKILGAMKTDPAYAASLLKQLVKGDAFLDATASFIAGQLISEAAPVLSAPKTEADKFVALTELPEPAQGDLFAFMKKCSSLDASQVDDMVPDIASSMLDAVKGDTTAMAALKDDARFKKSVKTRILNGFSDAFLDAMKVDASLALRMETALKQLPQTEKVLTRAIYEGGPGYPNPGPGKKSPEEGEALGKSQLMGITTLDVFANNLAKGFGPQGYFTFSIGDYWSTHSVIKSKTYPHPSFTSLAMHNKYCRGDMMSVNYDQVQTVDITEKEAKAPGMTGKSRIIKVPARKNVPMTMCYAYQDGKTHSILLINRSLDETRTVEFNLPYKPSKKATIHTLYHDNPMANNRTEYMTDEKAVQISDFKNGYEFQLKPHSVAIIVSEEK